MSCRTLRKPILRHRSPHHLKHNLVLESVTMAQPINAYPEGGCRGRNTQIIDDYAEMGIVVSASAIADVSVIAIVIAIVDVMASGEAI
jgi:hypothetical protein